LEAQFRQAQKMEAVGRLAAGVAHDFNNLLTVILGYSDLVLGELGPENSLRDSLVEVKKAGERASGLTRQLLAFSRQQLLEPRDVDVNETVTDCARMLQRLVGEDITLGVVQDVGLPHVKVDPGQLEQAIINLVVNARDAIPRFGKITITTSLITLTEAECRLHPLARPGPQVVLAVADTGSGMDEATLARIYEPFFTTKEPGKGTGLGLAMVFGFIQQSGGHITVASAPGQGTTFKIHLPALARAGAEALNLDRVEPLPGGSETILLVEDESAVRQLSRQLLEARGYTVITAAHGEEALRLAEAHAGGIDLLLTDVVMPGMGGGQLAEVIRERRPEIKILLVSGYSGEALNRHGGVTPGMNLLPKPFTVISLAVKVREVLDEPPGASL
jgi:CheY-like chemotaxis protein